MNARDLIFTGICSALCVLLAVMSTACLRVPVTVHPPHDAAGAALPLPTAPTGQVVDHGDGTATMNPDLRQPTPDDHPRPPATDWTGILLGVLGLALGGGGVAVPALRHVGRMRVALRSACELADEAAEAETDEEVDAAKRRAAAVQTVAGVRQIVQRVRGKA